MSKKVIIVGGVAGGASAAARLRRLDEKAEIILFEKDEYISFANCGLPYYIGDVITDRDKLMVQTPQAMMSRFNIDVRINSAVTQLDTVNKKVLIQSKERGAYEESYDYLVLSPGARALRPNIPGIDSEKIMTLRNIPDTDRIKAYVDQKGISSAVVIGGGFIGVEMAENLRERGLSVSLVEAAPHILAPFDTDMVLLAEKELVQNGIELVLGDGVKEFREVGSQVELTLNSGASQTADLIILAIGVAPETGFLRESGLDFGPRGHILVNEELETNVPGVYAVGDAITVVDYITKQETAIPLAGPANKQGRIAADNIAGLHSTYKGSQGTSILKVFELTAASTGANERTLQKAGVSYKTITIHPVSHASYYPEALPMTLKLIFQEDGRILGAQSIGYDGVDKRIDVIATVIRLKGTVNDLTELELAYAPPFSSAKDPVNMAGFVAQNVLSGKSKNVSWSDVEAMNPEEYILVDVRTEEEYLNGHVKGAINLPVDSLRERLKELDQEKTIVEYCQVGLRGYLAQRILMQNGFQVLNVEGGYKTIAEQLKSPGSVMKLVIDGSLHDNQRVGNVIINPDTQQVHAAEVDDVKGKLMHNESDKDMAAKILKMPVQNSIPTKTLSMAADKDMNTKAVTNRREEEFDLILDACGLCCPGPLMQVRQAMDKLEPGQIVKVIASDPGFYEDIIAWCRRTKNELLELTKQGAIINAVIQKNSGSEGNSDTKEEDGKKCQIESKDNKTMVVFSGDLDKAIASFIIANGAASMGRKVTMFFTFWGLNILRRPEKIKINKGLLDKMFGAMMPRGSKKLKLSKMNMMGMGGKMIRKVMKDKNISSLEDLIHSAIDQGIDVVACQMSMDVMGIRKEELIDGVKIGGVGYYLGEAEEADMNLFI